MAGGNQGFDAAEVFAQVALIGHYRNDTYTKGKNETDVISKPILPVSRSSQSRIRDGRCVSIHSIEAIAETTGKKKPTGLAPTNPESHPTMHPIQVVVPEDLRGTQTFTKKSVEFEEGSRHAI